MNKKLLLAPVILLIGGGIALTVNPGSQAAPARHLVSRITATPQAAIQDKTTQTTPATTTTTVAPQTASQPAPTAPAFSQDPNNPGQYIVYDKTSVMNSAGIPADQQADVDTAISRVSDWSYGNFLTLCKRGAGPSSMSTGTIRSSQASFGPSVYTDAVVQLKWCIQWMNDNNLTWQTL